AQILGEDLALAAAHGRVTAAQVRIVDAQITLRATPERALARRQGEPQAGERVRAGHDERRREREHLRRLIGVSVAERAHLRNGAPTRPRRYSARKRRDV